MKFIRKLLTKKMNGVTMASYKQLFKLNANIIEENDKIKEHNLYIKDYIESLENSK